MAIAIYARQSVEKDGSLSCEAQVSYCRSVLKPSERNEQILEYVDNGFSGGNVNRNAFQALMQEIRRGTVTKLVVYKLDRVSRSLRDFLDILATLKEFNVEFVSSQEAFDSSSPYGEMLTKLLAIFAEFERNSIIQRVAQAYNYRSELGLYMGGPRPYGYNLTPTVINGIKTKMLIPNLAEVDQIRYIFETYAVPGVSLRRVMANLVANNIHPTQGNWSSAKLSAIIRNPIYVCADNSIYEYFKSMKANIISEPSQFDGIHGVQLYGRTKSKADNMSDIKVVVMPHEGQVSAELWLACQRKLEKNKAFGPSLNNTTSWIGGRVFCKQCGRSMTVTKGCKKNDGSQTCYFNCSKKRLNMACDGPEVTIYAESLENLIESLIKDKISTFTDLQKKIGNDNTTRINVIKNRLSEIEKEEAKIVELLISGSTEGNLTELLNTKAKSLSDERRVLLAKISELGTRESEIISIKELLEKWETATLVERKSVVNVLIDKIYIHKDGTAEVVWNI